MAQESPFSSPSATVTKKGNGITVVATKRGEWSPLSMLSPDYKACKIRLQDSINNSNFEVRFYIEAYNRDSTRIKDRAFFPSVKSKFVCEVIPDILKNNSLILLIMTPEIKAAYYIQGSDHKHFKWKSFSEMSFGKDIPVFFIYEENRGEDLLEKKIDRLFESPSFRKLKTRKSIVEKIKPVTGSFYFFYYDVI
jgi:hypothetical protein